MELDHITYNEIIMELDAMLVASTELNVKIDMGDVVPYTWHDYFVDPKYNKRIRRLLYQIWESCPWDSLK
jgi:hypothetical protein